MSALVRCQQSARARPQAGVQATACTTGSRDTHNNKPPQQQTRAPRAWRRSRRTQAHQALQQHHFVAVCQGKRLLGCRQHLRAGRKQGWVHRQRPRERRHLAHHLLHALRAELGAMRRRVATGAAACERLARRRSREEGAAATAAASTPAHGNAKADHTSLEWPCARAHAGTDAHTSMQACTHRRHRRQRAHPHRDDLASHERRRHGAQHGRQPDAHVHAQLLAQARQRGHRGAAAALAVVRREDDSQQHLRHLLRPLGDGASLGVGCAGGAQACARADGGSWQQQRRWQLAVRQRQRGGSTRASRVAGVLQHAMPGTAAASHNSCKAGATAHQTAAAAAP